MELDVKAKLQESGDLFETSGPKSCQRQRLSQSGEQWAQAQYTEGLIQRKELEDPEKCTRHE